MAGIRQPLRKRDPQLLVTAVAVVVKNRLHKHQPTSGFNRQRSETWVQKMPCLSMPIK